MIRKFTPTHEWVLIQDTNATIGITKYAVKELGHIVFVELPKVGKIISLGQEATIVESTKAAVDICTPLSGEVIAVNQELLDNIQKINQFPESEGWLFQIRIIKPDELNNLIDKTSYEQMLHTFES
jgi:glycine cleavage system H protein